MSSPRGERKSAPQTVVYTVLMRFSLTTWNINSVRLRIDIVAKFLKSARPALTVSPSVPEPWSARARIVARRLGQRDREP